MRRPAGEEREVVAAGDGEGEVVGCVEACGADENVERDVGGGGEFDAGGRYAFDRGRLQVDLSEWGQWSSTSIGCDGYIRCLRIETRGTLVLVSTSDIRHRRRE